MSFDLDLASRNPGALGFEGTGQLARLRHVFAIGVALHERPHPFERRVVNRGIIGRGGQRNGRDLFKGHVVLGGTLDFGHIGTRIRFFLADRRAGLDFDRDRLGTGRNDFAFDLGAVVQLDPFGTPHQKRRKNKKKDECLSHGEKLALRALGRKNLPGFNLRRFFASPRVRWRGWPWPRDSVR